LKHHLGRYLRTLFSGIYDDIYVLSRLRVGMVHNRIGVPPKLYVSSMRTLLDILRSRLTGSRMEGQCGLCSNLSASLERFLLFDLSLVFDTYIHSLLGEVERSKQELEQYAQSLEAEVARRTTQLAELALNDPLTGLPHEGLCFGGDAEQLLAPGYLPRGDMQLIPKILSGMRHDGYPFAPRGWPRPNISCGAAGGWGALSSTSRVSSNSLRIAARN